MKEITQASTEPAADNTFRNIMAAVSDSGPYALEIAVSYSAHAVPAEII